MKTWDEITKKTTSISTKRKLEIEVVAYLVEAIAARRRQLNVTQAELGARINMSQSQIARVENCSTVPRLDTVILIADALGLQITLAEKEQAATLFKKKRGQG